MKVVLAFPPQAVPFLPHQAPAQLVAVLKSRGISAMQKDYNLEAYEYFLSSGRLKQFGISPMMAEQVEEEKSNLRNGKDFFVPDKYFQSIAVLQNYLGNISGQYPGCRFSFKDFEIAGYDTEKSRDIIQASGDEKRNPFIDFFKEKIEELKQLEPQILGISIAWKSQLVPGFTLARLVKKYLPHTHICMGGSMISHLSDLLKTRVELFEYTDSFIPFDGEIGLAELAENIEGKNFSKVSGLIYKHKGKIISNPVSIPTNLNLLPLPDFSGLELDKYYSPKVYLPVNLSRGCYWSGCQFCTHHLSASSFRIKNPVTMLEEMNSLNNRYGCSNFYFVDDAFPPEQGKVLAELIRKNEKSYRWAGEFRMEKMMDEDYFHTLHDGGCRLALFGLESYCDRILNKMNKGWDTSRVKNILASAHNAGIKTW
ncbi:MAG: B12-binding domain-containing radical SAM protein, partial [Vulcanimicrobiota bacterium]